MHPIGGPCHDEGMASDDLFFLWNLHKIDAAIHEIRQRAANLDPGRKLMAELSALENQLSAKQEAAKTVSGAFTDAELEQKGIEAKIKKFDAELYGGKIVNPREVEAHQKEIASLKSRIGELDLKILELMEQVTPLKAEADAAQRAVEAKRAELAEYQKQIMVEKKRMEERFKELNAQRPEAAKKVNPSLMPRYEAIRQKFGYAMTKIDPKGNMCGACGTHVPVKSIESAKEDRIVTCESCHRILYWSESLV